ncbi:MAG: sulfotransferase [Steroidobacteraceae bacterium]
MIKGFIESVDQFQVRGWAYEAESPDAFLEIEIFCNGSRLGITTANLYRDDLERAGVGRGNHAFILNLERPLSETDLSRISAIAVGPVGARSELSPVSRPAAEPETDRPTLAFAGSTSDDRKFPVFILGAARSGTSAVTQALLRLPRFEGEEEGHALDLLAHFSVCLEKFYRRKADELGRRTMVARVPRQYFDDAIDHLFRDLAADCYRQEYWVEKTPNSDAVYLAPRFRKIWPRARFIFMKRRGIENVKSRQTKFPGVDFALHCKDWASAMTAWRLVREQLRGCAIEVDLLHLAQQPRAAGAQLGRFLGLDESEIDSVGQFFSSERPQRTGASLSCVVDPAEIDWDAAMWNTFKENCAESMHAFKYGFGSDYFQDGASDEMVKFT